MDTKNTTKEKLRTYQKMSNPKYAKWRKQWTEENRENINKNMREWRKRNQSKLKTYYKKRYAPGS